MVSGIENGESENLRNVESIATRDESRCDASERVLHLLRVGGGGASDNLDRAGRGLGC